MTFVTAPWNFENPSQLSVAITPSRSTSVYAPFHLISLILSESHFLCEFLSVCPFKTAHPY